MIDIQTTIASAARNAATLGKPLPQAPHAVSMALPLWQHVIGYEKKDPAVADKLETGYPRFVLHHSVAQAAAWLGQGVPCLPLPSQKSAQLCASFVRARTGQDVQVIRRGNLQGVTLPSRQTQDAARDFWQHTGLIVSSRCAQALLSGKDHSGDPAVYEQLRRRLAALYGCEEKDVFLEPSGMAAQYAAFRAVMTRAPGLPTVQLGFPYVDTFKLQQKFGNRAIMFHDLSTIQPSLRELLARERIAACFGEIPGNPLLGSADLAGITPLLHEHGVPFVADDVVATPFNVDLRPHADLIATSLTKFLTGRGDLMAGALICNPRSPFYDTLSSLVRAEHEDLLWHEDAVVAEELSRDFPERMRRHNDHGLLIAERLRKHPAVDRVWYPKWECSQAYDAVRRPGGGWGALVTFLPRQSERNSPRVYDRLDLCKGPSLGTMFTLACPFTLLAHFNELDWAEQCGVPRNLLRISVGLEDPETVWAKIADALNEVN